MITLDNQSNLDTVIASFELIMRMKKNQEGLDVVSKARDELEAMCKATQWRPIDAAPKDGTELLLKNVDNITVVGRWSKHNHIPLYGWVRQIDLYGEEVDGFDPICFSYI